MQEVKTNIKLNEKDYINFELAAFLGSFTKNLGMILMACLFVYLVWNYNTNGGNFWLVVISALPTLTYLAAIFYFIPKNSKEDFSRSSYINRTPLFAITNETITIERDSGNISTIKLPDLASVFENKSYFYFFITKSNTLMVPKRLLQTDEITFIRSAFSSLPKKIRRNPFKIKPLQLLGTILTFLFIAFCIVMIIWSFTNGGGAAS